MHPLFIRDKVYVVREFVMERDVSRLNLPFVRKIVLEIKFKLKAVMFIYLIFWFDNENCGITIKEGVC